MPFRGAEGVASGALPAGAREGINDLGRHRHFFKWYALDTVRADLRRPGKTALEQAMRGRVRAQATPIGTYRSTR
jgi:phosphatidylethanolamine-binding protein (PEBP) family uncharacterized protein